MNSPRHFALDIIRVLACLMVVIVHSGECYYIGKFYAGGFDAIDWNTWYSDATQAVCVGTILRTSVPLFVMISGFLLLPMKQGLTTWSFLRKRFTRILIPLLCWVVFYAFYQPFEAAGWSFTGYNFAAVGSNLLHSLLSFPPVYGHLWYVYMLIGLYLLIPVLSPWVERASRGEMLLFLGLWVIGLVSPYLKLFQPDLFAQTYWNPNGTFYYFTGFIGYLVLGAYARKYLSGSPAVGKQRVLGACALVLGFAWALTDILGRVHTGQAYCTPDNYGVFFEWFEFCWNFNTVPVALMTVGMFLLLYRISVQPGRLLMSISRLSYGMYLLHIVYVAIFYAVFDALAIPTACKILLIGCVAYCSSYLTALLLSFLPKSKYLIG